MSDVIKHECGIALIRLRKPLSYFLEKYGSLYYGIKKLYLLMEKQHNRGQDGAGVASIKLDVPQGSRYISRYRSVDQQPIADIFKKINQKFKEAEKEWEKGGEDPKWFQENVAFSGEILMGHLRYGTHGKNSIETCHPIIRQSNWRSRNLVMAGNFNMTNVDELFEMLVELGQHPKEKADTVTVLEKIGHFLDEENQRLFQKYKEEYTNLEISHIIAEELDLQRVLRRSCKDFDGGYAMTGIIGSGAVFAARDPVGIRPAYYYADDEVVVVASEKPAIKTTFNVPYDAIKEVTPGSALIINRQGDYHEAPFIQKAEEKKACSFERIYFSRGSDPDIYRERKDLGRRLCPQILETIDYDLQNTVFSYIPNTAETAFRGMMEGIQDFMKDYQKKEILKKKPSEKEIDRILSIQPRIEKLVIKDAKLRTFITEDDQRDDLVAHVYDTTYEVIRKHKDTLVVIDDSIVRGTTLEKSILRMLDRLQPKKIIIVSSCPQIRFPDCYGIDMSRMKDFVVFRAMLALLKEHKKEYMLEEVYQNCVRAMSTAEDNSINYVKALYDQFTQEEISRKVAEIITPSDLNAEVDVIFQTVDNLHQACPNNTGDWYFTGNFPTPGGHHTVNKAFVYFMEGKTVRAY